MANIGDHVVHPNFPGVALLVEDTPDFVVLKYSSGEKKKFSKNMAATYQIKVTEKPATKKQIYNEDRKKSCEHVLKCTCEDCSRWQNFHSANPAVGEAMLAMALEDLATGEEGNVEFYWQSVKRKLKGKIISTDGFAAGSDHNRTRYARWISLQNESLFKVFVLKKLECEGEVG